MRLILASASPRRRELLTTAGYQFDVVMPEDGVEVGLCSNCGPAEMVAELATAKAASAVRKLTQNIHDNGTDNAIVLAADTVAECGGHILGKPTNENHARRMLGMLSGRKHRVYTGVCVWPLVDEMEIDTHISVTTLRMDKLTNDQLDDYLAGDQWQGKAGAFGYQDRLGWVHIVEGSESNVVGLPMDLVAEMLRAVNCMSGRKTCEQKTP